MGGVDRADQLASTYCFLRKSLKWWRKLFFGGSEICSINSYILYKSAKKQRKERPLTHLQYAKTLVDQLRGDFRQTRHRASTSTYSFDEVRLNEKLHVMLELERIARFALNGISLAKDTKPHIIVIFAPTSRDCTLEIVVQNIVQSNDIELEV